MQYLIENQVIPKELEQTIQDNANLHNYFDISFKGIKAKNYCEFDEFSMDNELNRFFLYAIRTFKKFSAYPNLHRCEAVLDDNNN